jgi:hypothetical protein
MGQYRSDTSTERLYDRVNFDLYYSTSADFVAPTIYSVGGLVEGAVMHLKVGVNDPSGVHRVAVAYTTGQVRWQYVDLVYDSTMEKWRGDIPSGATWFIQAVDEAGNVAVSDNKGIYYTDLAQQTPVNLHLPIILR